LSPVPSAATLWPLLRETVDIVGGATVQGLAAIDAVFEPFRQVWGWGGRATTTAAAAKLVAIVQLARSAQAEDGHHLLPRIVGTVAGALEGDAVDCASSIVHFGCKAIVNLWNRQIGRRQNGIPDSKEESNQNKGNANDGLHCGPDREN